MLSKQQQAVLSRMALIYTCTRHLHKTKHTLRGCQFENTIKYCHQHIHYIISHHIELYPTH